jgi:glycosyltransferase involved in cell wall biosynthesis
MTSLAFGSDDAPPSPRFSVIIPTCDRPRMLAEAVASVRNQTVRDFEIVIVNDGTSAISLPDERGLRIVEGRRRGPAAARNDGLDAAKGQFVAFLDDDDLFTPKRLEVPTDVPVSICRLRDSHGQERFYDLQRAAFAAQQVTIRRDYCPTFDEELIQGEDFDWAIRVLAMGDPAEIDQVGYVYRPDYEAREPPLMSGSASRLSASHSPQVRLRTVLRVLRKNARFFADNPDVQRRQWARAAALAWQSRMPIHAMVYSLRSRSVMRALWRRLHVHLLRQETRPTAEAGTKWATSRRSTAIARSSPRKNGPFSAR